MKRQAKSMNPLPYAVLGFQIENFGGIKKTEVHDLPNSAKWIFLTGENGYGKTTVLQAVAANIANDASKLSDRFKIEIEFLLLRQGGIILESLRLKGRL